MTTDFNWIRPNIYSRSEDKNLDFNIQFKPYRWFTRYSFDRAVRLTTKKIKYKFHTIFLLLKGDLDSELILKSFIQYKLKFKVLIIKTSGNKEDSEIAMNLCKEVGIIPVIIELNDIDYLKIYYENILKQLNGYGIDYVPELIACKYAKDRCGVAILPNCQITYLNNKILPIYSEWDFYGDFFIGQEHSLNYFSLKLEMMDSILVHINDKPVEMAKAELYGLKYKPKLINKFPNNFINLTEKLNSQFNRKANPSLVMEKQD